MGADRLRPLNQPTPVMVRVDHRGWPSLVMLRRHRLGVRAVADRWLVEDGWWRHHHDQRRLYFQLQLEGGRDCVIYRDLVEKNWWLHRG